MSTFNSLEFDGVNSLDYGIYITGESVYNAPERDVESLEIAGRNGDYLLDKGRWKNIDVTYTAGAFGSDQSEFATKIRQFRNLLASRYGYHRLTDTYNPNEYRLGVFKNAVEVEASSYNRAGEFDLVFNCKPQRYLTSGETELTVTSGQTINNPTLFDSSPLLQVWGYGDISINGEFIKIDNTVIGETTLVAGDAYSTIRSVKTFSEDTIRAGDTITLKPVDIFAPVTSLGDASITGYTGSPSITQGAEYVNTAVGTTAHYSSDPRTNLVVDMTLNALRFTAGTPSTVTIGIEQNGTYTYNGESGTFTMYVALSVAYTSGRIAITCIVTTNYASYFQAKSTYYRMGEITAYSTKSALGEPLYFDMDIGEAYKIENGEYISVNNAVIFPAELPALQPGANIITFDNTVDNLKIVPRWWIL